MIVDQQLAMLRMGNGRQEEVQKKWVKHYSSSHQTLLVGEGDFSFALSLAVSFGSASKIVASSLDSYEDVITKYKDAKSNLDILWRLGALIIHGVDATKMKVHSYLQMRKFDRIIFNFPHAGFYGREDSEQLIRRHQELVKGFFRNANCMLRPDGEIHLRHKTSFPYCRWNIESLALQNSLVLHERVDFKIADYPGYNNKRGATIRCDEPFPLGKCSTFKFRFVLANKTICGVTSHSGILCKESWQGHGYPIQVHSQPPLSDQDNQQTSFTKNMNGFPHDWQFLSGTCFRREINDRCFNHALETCNRDATLVLPSNSVLEKMYLFERCIVKASEGPLHGNSYHFRGAQSLSSTEARRLLMK